LTINRDAYPPTNRSGFSLGHYGYYPGNIVGAAKNDPLTKAPRSPRRTVRPLGQFSQGGKDAGHLCWSDVLTLCAYDALGNLTNIQSSTLPSFQSSISYAYDLANQRTFSCLQIGTQQSALSNSYFYDALGRVTGITNNFIAATYSYDSLGNLTGKNVRTIGNQYSVENLYGYDSLDRLSSLASGIHHPASNSVIDSFSYVYEQKRSLIDHIGTYNGTTHSFSYDPAGQLIHEDENRFSYDLAGRIISDGTVSGFYSRLIAYWSFDGRRQLKLRDENEIRISCRAA